MEHMSYASHGHERRATGCRPCARTGGPMSDASRITVNITPAGLLEASQEAKLRLKLDRQGPRQACKAPVKVLVRDDIVPLLGDL